jgi:hypothetical protein
VTRFEDGPVKGVVLQLQRAPIFLRAVESSGTFDALDQPNDTPNANETLYAYVLTEPPGYAHFYYGGGRGGWLAIANYRLVTEQPFDSEMRNTARWRAWCGDQLVPKNLRPFAKSADKKSGGKQ